MALTRSINAPGIEIREIDRSQYSVQDNSLPNAPTVLIHGFADFGENYTVKWINNIKNLIKLYGYPQTEFEQLFHNACIEILNRGGVCLAAKLPYNNNETKGYTYCEYQFLSQNNNILQSEISSIQFIDSNLTSYTELSSTNKSGKMSIEEFDEFKVGESSSIKDKIRIVDISKGRYTKSCFNSVSSASDSGQNNECLGIFPVIVSPTNALYWQYIQNSQDERLSSVQLSNFNPINQLSTIDYNSSGKCNEFDILQQIVDLSKFDDNSLLSTCSNNNYDQTISKIASQQFPLMNFMNADHLDTTYLKQIGVIVFKAYSDESNSNKTNFEVLESFIGSLDKTARSKEGSSLFIDNIINNNSNYINFFSNIDKNRFSKTSTIHIVNQHSRMLGFYRDDCVKNIDVQESIVKPLTTILDTIKDPNQYPLDIIVDAGVSNIAQYIETKSKSNQLNNFVWELSNDPQIIKKEIAMWNLILKKFDDFCKYTRKDCMFIADVIRPFCLIGDQKIVRKTKLGSSVTKDILPRLRYISGLNSSYSAGYCNWFQASDYYTGDLFWCPPSIKASSVYIYCDTYFHIWDAPAGFTRGILPQVVDVAFSPSEEEAGKIYNQSWNYAINYPIEGIILEGQKTFQTNKTALDRVNVRRLLLGLEKGVISIGRKFLYEGNTEYLRQKFVDSIKQLFEDAVNGNGISEYAIKCDDELNTQQVIDNNELKCRIAVKPVKTIEYIVLDFICTNQSASVSEEVLK